MGAGSAMPLLHLALHCKRNDILAVFRMLLPTHLSHFLNLFANVLPHPSWRITLSLESEITPLYATCRLAILSHQGVRGQGFRDLHIWSHPFTTKTFKNDDVSRWQINLKKNLK